ncbi:NADH-quinone oxidoreductase subunit NuoF [Endozoicomonas sp. SM1973]|uniref:NADH-quinone oxidoreductase subunit F n=1 Tax=Spartinivicinus marinus TaxID=2994442 RepID=A0A853I3T8_9GAMM|nr:NADH-quinone oxidoreductase subunit NuoF [Spartinivicinus marinus]MCX4028163.1 NADH-quinone oxidoreductase subunit NuoF [Spartinivicinus marinus]NYZ66162.1 NADH-quinone oxidoreductase subunit NuoF [Spartinivicinus marinus]
MTALTQATTATSQPAGQQAPIKVFVPCDSSSLSVGADQIAATIETLAVEYQANIQLVRNGSRGLFWLEPLIEVATADGRVAYGPVQPEDITSLFECDFLSGDPQHPLYLGLTEKIPYLAKQQRLTFQRAGIIEPASIEDYTTHQGFIGLQKALEIGPQAIIDEVKQSGLRGRGGAAFPTGIKWQTVLDTPATQKYIVCNADEGDSGSFADRLVMEADPFSLIEGMTIAGIAVGANQGYIYLRSEYPHAHQMLNKAIAVAYQHGYLGNHILGSDFSFDLEVRLGAGAYICGEETSLLESLEGKRGLVRAKPPIPAIEGLFGQPTIVNNVLSLATVPIILEKGAAYYEHFGMGRSRGTLAFQLAGNIKQGGLVELAFGISLRELLEEYGAGTLTGRPIKAVQVGGPLGAYLPEHQWDTPLDYEAFMQIDAMVGHGGIVVFDDRVDMLEQARFAMEFCVEESCGKCTPCRIGSTRGVEVIDKIRAGDNTQANTVLLTDLCDTMTHASLCAMGGMTPYPVMSALNHFPEDFQPTNTKTGGC